MLRRLQRDIGFNFQHSHCERSVEMFLRTFSGLPLVILRILPIQWTTVKPVSDIYVAQHYARPDVTELSDRFCRPMSCLNFQVEKISLGA